MLLNQLLITVKGVVAEVSRTCVDGLENILQFVLMIVLKDIRYFS
jgi:hypothetical protein